MIWDRALGYQYIKLNHIPYGNDITSERWYSVDTELHLLNGEISGTSQPTGHMLLLDCRFELPYGKLLNVRAL